MRLLFFWAPALLASAVLVNAETATERGFDHFYNLEFDQAIDAFQKALEEQPEDPKRHLRVVQGLLYREMLRSGALESELVSGNNPFLSRQKMVLNADNDTRLQQAIARAMELCKQRLAANANDVDALYADGVAHALRGNYNFLVRKAWTDALKDATQARKRHARVRELRPEMVDALMVEGLHDYVVGSLPWTYKMLGFIVGFRGDKQAGIRALQTVAAKGNLNRTDAKVLLAVVYRRERMPQQAIPLLLDLMKDYPRNYLYRFELVQMYADAGDKNKALAALAELDRLKQTGTAALRAMPGEKINFSRGNLLFWYRDYDEAIRELRKAAGKRQQLDLNTASMTFLRLGQCLDMKQNREQAVDAYRSAIEIAPDSDAARQSKQYLNTPYKRAKNS
ncbi:MAG: tetratricopeptide repeat protein [Bryobacterales bacterium]|nr:tetratricopeptide repeat protein [Bryobacterales bacterium]